VKDSQLTPKDKGLDKGLQDKDIVCLGHLRRIFPLLDRLNDVGCQRDTAGNRQLFFGDYCKLVLLYVWNPLIDSLRQLQTATQLRTVAKALGGVEGAKRFSLGSFSEAPRVFEPQLLQPIIAELAGELSPIGKDPRLAELKHALTLVDGTVVAALARLAKAAVGDEARYNTSRDGRAVYAWRMHTQLDLETFSPRRIERTGARNAGENRENNVLRRNLEPGRCYVGDGGYADRSLFDDIVANASSYVIRLAQDAVFEVAADNGGSVGGERLLSQEALDAGIVRDAVLARLGVAGAAAMNHPVRLIAVQVQPHPRRARKGTGKGTGKGTEHHDLILIATNLLDLPAELVALIYLYRYTVELFFRIFKQLLGMRHLLSQRQSGIDIQIHCTLIVCLLLCLITGHRPDKTTRNMIGWYLIGLASEQELIDHLNRPDNTGIKKRAKDALWKKMGW
jgi:hypothetical protein